MPYQNDWIFFLVFHFGFVLYLILHNLGVPLLAMLGSGKFSWELLQIWFLPQMVLLYAIYKKKEFLGKTIILYTHIILGFGIIHLIYIGKQIGPNKSLFTYTISLLSLIFFLLGWHIKFKSLFPNKNVKKKYLLATLMAILHILYNYFSFEKLTSATLKEKNISTITSEEEVQYNKSKWELEEKGEKITQFEENGLNNEKNTFIYIKNSKEWVLANNTNKNIHVRVEFYKDNRWIFKKLIILKKKTKISYLAPLEDGIYRVFSPTHAYWKKQLVYKYEN